MNNYYSPYALPSYAMPSYPAPLISNDIAFNKFNPNVNNSVNNNTNNNANNNINNQPQINLGLRQLQNFSMIDAFQDNDGHVWKLVKSANDASVEIPDPQFVQITDFWNHEFPNSDGKVFVYVIEGIKRPRVDNEKPVNVLYQWFSTTDNPNFNPQMITQAEWHRANVYTSPISSSRVSKLKALCKYTELQPPPEQDKVPDIDIKLPMVMNQTKEK